MKKNVTELDLVIATALYPILVDLARGGRERLTYGELVEFAKLTYPDNEAVQSLIPVGSGRRLDAVRMFTDAKDYPDLTSLIVEKGSQECGKGFVGDAQKAREEVYAFDWSAVEPEFNLHVAELRKNIKIPKRRPVFTEAQAVQTLLAFARSKGMTKSIPNRVREQIVASIRDGVDVSDAFASVGY